MYKYLLSLSLFFSCSQLLWSQVQNVHFIDSLTKVIKDRPNQDAYLLLHELSASYVDKDNERAFRIANLAEPIALAAQDSLLIIKCQRLRGQILYRLGKPQAAIALVEPLFQNWELRGHDDEYLAVANLLAVSHLNIGQFDKALSYSLQTKLRAETMQDDEYTAISLKNVGIAYYKLKDYAKALPFMLQSYRMERALNAQNFATPMNLSLCYTHLADFKKAEEFLRESKMICGDDCGLVALVHITYASGSIFFGLKEYVKAEADFLESLRLAKKIGDTRMELDNVYLLAKMSIEQRDLKKAEYYLKHGERLSQVGTPFNVEMIKVYQQLGELYLSKKDFERAAFYQSKYISLKDSIYNEDVTSSLMKIESKFLQKDNEIKIATQHQVILLKEQMLHRQSVLNIVATSFALTAIAFLVLLFRSYMLKKKMNVLLERKIRQRTSELETKVGSLLTKLSERDIEFDRFASTILEATNSLKGLAMLARDGMSETEAKLYFASIQDTIRRLISRTNDFALRRVEKR